MTGEEEKSQNESVNYYLNLDEGQMCKIMRHALWENDPLGKKELCLVGFLVFDERELASSNEEYDTAVKARIGPLGSYSELSFMERFQYLQKTRVLSEVFFIQNSKAEIALRALEAEAEKNEWVVIPESVEQLAKNQRENEL